MTSVARLALLFSIASSALLGASFSAQGTNLTVTSGKLQVSFSGADVVGIANQLTGEKYLRNPSTNMQLNLTLVQAPNQALAASGTWTVNSAGTSASLSFTDSNRTVSVAVSVDPATQEVVVNLDGKAKQGGVERLIWGVTGFDLTAGRFILPATGGVSLTSASFAAQNSFTFSVAQGSPHWEAPLSLFQSAQGGVAIYSTDMRSLFKDLNLSVNQRQTVNEWLEVEAPGPWNSAVEAGPIEWRLAAYQGDWQAGARIYRDWHNAAAPPIPLTGARAWAGNIRTVVTFAFGLPYAASLIDPLTKVVNPAETLLYLTGWRTSNYDVNYPDYTPDPSVKALVDHAHQLGFHVMLHTDMIGVSPLNSDWTAVQQFQTKDPLSLQVQGWFWNLPTLARYGFIDPASSIYRTLFVNRVTNAIQTLAADAIHLDIAGWPINDGNGMIEGMNYNQGAAQLHRDLLAAFPGLVLGTEGTNDTISPYGSFVQQQQWPATFGADVTPPVPISAYLLSNVQPYANLALPNPDQGGFLDVFTQYEGQGVLPTFFFYQGQFDFTQPDWARYLKVIDAFQTNGLKPAWDTNWNGAIVGYQGTSGSSATVADSGTLVQFNLQKSGSSSLIYQRVHASSQIDSSVFVPNWPAYNGNLTLGLDPAYQYWLDSPANNPLLPHVTGLPSGVRLGLGTGTLVTPQFAYFQLLPPASASFDFFANLWLANVGVTYNGADFPLGNGATADLTTMVVGGVTRKAIFTSPPWMAQRGGETFLEYTVPLPAGNAAISFAAGIRDSAIGTRQGPMTFKVQVNGTILWQQDVSTGGWQAGSIDLSPWLGQTIKLRFVSNPGPSGNSTVAWGGWSALQMSAAANEALDGVTLAVPPALTPSNILVTGGSASVSNGTATIHNLPAGGSVMVFTGQPAAVSAGQSLLDIPFTKSQSSTGQLAGPSQVGGAGDIGPTTSGGIAKQRTLYAFPPDLGQTILSWYLQLPASPNLALSFSAAYRDGFTPASQGFLMSVRVNGATLWQYGVNLPAAWEYGAVDLSPWSGQTVVLELITDSQGHNTAGFTSWAELTFGAGSSANCATSLSSSAAIGAPAAGATGTISVTTASGCNWTAAGGADWIAATPSSAAGNGTATYTIAANIGPARQSTLTVAGHALAVSQAAAQASSAPEITAVVNRTGETAVIAQNTWVEIYGVNLAPDARGWQQSDIVNGQMPTQLDGVSATVNGKPAFVGYVSPNQVNVLTPLDSTQGTVQVQLTNGAATSAPVYVPTQPLAPGFFTFGGGSYVAAQHANWSYVGPTTLYPGASFPAKPGEVVVLYANGFGQTSPPMTNGSSTQSANLPTLPVIKVGGIVAQVQFAGVVAPGLYQFNIAIPTSVPDGDNPLVATYGGYSTQPGVLIFVQH